MNRDQLLTRLRNLTTEMPTTKMGQVRWAWQDIQSALDAGHTLLVVHERLNEVGIEIGYRTLSLYIGRLQREQGLVQRQPVTSRTPERKQESVSLEEHCKSVTVSNGLGDPFANIRQERERKRNAGFEYDAFSINKNLLE